MYTWISRVEFNEIVEPIIPYMMRHPYILLFYALLIKVAQWQHDAREHVPTDFVFDAQGPVDVEAVIFYPNFKAIQKPEIAALMGSTSVFRDDKLVLPLQAADMVAGHKRRCIDKPGDIDSQSPTGLLNDLTYAEAHLSKEILTVRATEAAKLLRISFVHDKPKGYRPGMTPEQVYRPKNK